MNLELQIPDDVARFLKSEYADLPRAAVEALALEGYRSKRLSDGQVRQMLGFSSRMQVHAFLKAHDVPLNYSIADLNLDRETSQDLALTYQAHGLDLGVIEKRVGDYYNDNGSYHNQGYVAPFNNVNLFFNYTIRKNRMFDESKISFSVNNLFNSENITDFIAFGNSAQGVGGSAYIGTTAISPIDQLNLTAGRSFTVTFKVGVFPGRRE